MVMPWKHAYDGIIVNHMEDAAVVLAYKNRYRKERERKKKRMSKKEISYLRDNVIDIIDGKCVIKLVQKPQSVTDITHAIQDAGYPKARRETVYDHLDELEKKQVVTMLPKKIPKRRGIPTEYVLSKMHPVHCLDTLPDTMYEFISKLGTLRRILYVLDLEAGAPT
jgi:hypothetical protein